MSPQAYIIWGVSGSGKSTIAKLLANQLSIDYYDADDFHSPENVERMRSGQALTDELRHPWLQSLHRHMVTQLDAGLGLTLACSCLKYSYRDLLKQNNPRIHFLYLKGSYDLIHKRMASRSDHYMPTSLLKSQFDILEEPTEGPCFDIAQAPQTIVEAMLTWINKQSWYHGR